MTITVHAYLAGPDIFFPNPFDIAAEKIEILKKHDIIGHFPLDNTIDIKGMPPKEQSDAIGLANEQLMLECCKVDQISIILANMTPYHGPSMDVGTAFEMGFFSALATVQDNIIIIGYTDDKRNFEERVVSDHFGGCENITKRDGITYDPHGNEIETFQQIENLMMTHAMHKTNAHIVYSFEEAAKLARSLADAKTLAYTKRQIQAA